MTCKEYHQRGCLAGSLEGCWILAGGNTPGRHVIMPLRPGGALEYLSLFKVLKVIKGIIPKSTLDLGYAMSQRLCFSAVKKLVENKGKPGENRREPAKKLAMTRLIKVVDGALRRLRRLKRRNENEIASGSITKRAAGSLPIARGVATARLRKPLQTFASILIPPGGTILFHQLRTHHKRLWISPPFYYIFPRCSKPSLFR